MSRASAFGFLSQAELQVCSHYWPASKDVPYVMVPPGLEADLGQEEPLTQELPERFFFALAESSAARALNYFTSRRLLKSGSWLPDVRGTPFRPIRDFFLSGL